MDITLGLGSLIGGIFSGWGQRSAAEKQLQAQRETNEQNYKIWQEQKEHNVDMYNMEYQGNLDMYNLQHRNNVLDWRMQQEYNTASAQRQRLEDAGLNPYLMMNGGNAGYATTAPASASASSAQVNPSQAPTMETAHPSAFTDPISLAVENIVQSFEGLNVGLNQGASAKATGETTPAVVNNIEADTENKKANTDKTKSETTGINIDNSYKDKKNAVEFDLMDKQAKLLEDDVLMRNMTFNDRVITSTLKRMDMMLDTQMKSVALQYMPAEKVANLELMAIQYALAVSQKKLNEASAKNMLASAFASYATGQYYSSLAYGQDMQNEVMSSGLSYQKDANRLYWQGQKEQNWFDFDVAKNYNDVYRFRQNLLGFGKAKGIGNDYATKLFDNAMLSLKLNNVTWGANIETITDHGFSRWIGDAARGAFSGWLPMSAGYNVNQSVAPESKKMRPIGFRF